MKFKHNYREFLEGIKDTDHWDRERFVPATGDLESDHMLIGEAPGANEVEQKEPFVGRAGDRLNEILSDIGVERSELYITNLVKVRPPDNRDPKKEEIEAWSPLLEREIEEVDPEIILTLGNFPSKYILDTDKGISQIHGRIFSRERQKIMPVYHPAATLYDRSKGPVLEKDLRKAFGKEETGQQKLGDLS